VLVRRLALLAAVGLASWPASAPAQSPVRVTVVGDSIAAALDYVPEARHSLERGFDVRLDLRVCRRLATAGCAYQGAVPSSALDAVRAAGGALGQVLVVDVGYNDDPAAYRPAMDAVIRAAQASGVRAVVWVTLRNTNGVYARTDAVIRGEAQRFPAVEVADWSAFSRGRPWFRPDGLHLNADGAAGLAAMLRPLIVRAAAAQAP
jgi:hypothetical protein